MTWILVAVAAILAGAIIFALRRPPAPAPEAAQGQAAAAASTDTPKPRTLVDRLQPDFRRFSVPTATAQTFELLISSISVFGFMLIAWAAAAGIMRAAWLVSTQPGAAVLQHPPQSIADALAVSTLGLVATEIFRGVGGTLAVAAAAGMVGALLGFIFGIPRPVSASESPPAGAGGMVPASGAAAKGAKRAWELSTNLTQVSDWLTKIIVGVGLVEGRKLLLALSTYSDTAAGWLFAMRHGSPIIMEAVIVCGGVFGFLFAYLYTQLIIARLIAATDSELDQPSGRAVRTLKGMESWFEGLVPRISRSMIAPDVIPAPTLKQLGAALSFEETRLDALIADPGVTRDYILSWARARAVLNDYDAAAKGYIHLLEDDDHE